MWRSGSRHASPFALDEQWFGSRYLAWSGLSARRDEVGVDMSTIGRVALPTGFVVIEAGRAQLAPLGESELIEVPAEAVLAMGVEVVGEEIGVLASPAERDATAGPSPPLVLRTDGTAILDWSTERKEWVAVSRVRIAELLSRRPPVAGQPAANNDEDVEAERGTDRPPLAWGRAVALRLAGASRRNRRRALRLAASTVPRRPGRPSDDPVEPSQASSAETIGSAAPVRVFPVYGAPGGDPSLALGMIVARLRQHRDGALDRLYDIRPPMTTPEPLWQALDESSEPVIAMFADYSWTLDANLLTSAEVKRRAPGSITVHGGPHVPREPTARDTFLTDHPEVDVVVRFEGELTTSDLLSVLDGDLTRLTEDELNSVEGLSFRAGSALVHTPDRERLQVLDELPSPFLTGVFDHVDPEGWRIATLETTRGCPYRCTFCDWGSATGTKARYFALERVRRELEWVSRRGIEMLFIADANFGESERDVDLARWIADLHRENGSPETVIASFAKNNVEHITEIVDIWRRAGIKSEGLTALQTIDPITLRNVRRHNISVDVHDELTERFRAAGLPLLTDLLIGLPGSTVESFKADLQRCMDLEVTPRIAEVEMLPNSPLNEPEYRQRMRIETGPKQTITSTYSCTPDDVLEMLRLRLLFRGCEHFGILRHVLRFVQHEHGVRAADLLHEIDRTLMEEPDRYPGLSWVGRYLDSFLLPPVHWEPFYAEVGRFLSDRYGITHDSSLQTVLEVQIALMPAKDRVFPTTIELEHDYVAWFRSLPRGDARPHRSREPLSSYPPGRLTVSDPQDVCGRLLKRNEFETRRDQVAENLFWMVDHWELASELERPLAANARPEPDGR